MAEEPAAAVSIEVQNLVKRYPKATFNAVDDISSMPLMTSPFPCHAARFLAFSDQMEQVRRQLSAY